MTETNSHCSADPSELPRVGLVAGNGGFPAELIRSVREKGNSIVAALHCDESDPELEQLVDASIWIRVGQMGKVLRFFKEQGVRDVVFLGGIQRKLLLKNFRPDLVGMKILSRVKSVEDDRILRGVAEEFEREGYRVLDPKSFLSGSTVRKKLLTTRSLSEEETQNAKVGWGVAKRLGEADVGQTVVTARGMVVALEAVEGTDETIRRAGTLSPHEPCVVVKLPKPQQDRRLDLPAVGPRTIQVMHESNCSALVLERGGALLLQEDSVIELANKHQISIMAFESEDELLRECR